MKVHHTAASRRIMGGSLASRRTLRGEGVVLTYGAKLAVLEWLIHPTIYDMQYYDKREGICEEDQEIEKDKLDQDNEEDAVDEEHATAAINHGDGYGGDDEAYADVASHFNRFDLEDRADAQAG